MLRLFSSAGEPLAPAGTVVPISMTATVYANGLALASRADGSMQMVATYDDPADATTEVTVIDIDPSGAPTGSMTQLGTADDAVPYAAAAADLDGTTLLAWERRYGDCPPLGTDATVASSIDPAGSTGAITDLDPAGFADTEPALATSGTSAYIAWTHVADAGTVVRVARADGATGAAVDVGLAPVQNRTPALALADGTHGALAWATYEPDLRIATLAGDGPSAVVGEPHVISVSNGAALSGIVHVGEQKYLIAWTDSAAQTIDEVHLYATVIDLAEAPRPVPPVTHPARPPVRPNRCHL
jgi:hypothetical protein